MFSSELIKEFNNIQTPFYYYDTQLLERTLDAVESIITQYGYNVHYAMKANANPTILNRIQQRGFGADCVSGNEVALAAECNFPSEKIFFAGVGKSDNEIITALNNNIFCFNCESIQEIEVINEIASKIDKTASIALRLNPNVDAHTHKHITTGTDENKFGINLSDIDDVLNVLSALTNVKLIGIHFHIGSQITKLDAFKELCNKINEIQQDLLKKGIQVPELNLGGGLGIDYHNPDENLIPNFESFFKIVNENLKPLSGQRIHFELGRSLVAQCGTLITKVLYTKPAKKTIFAIVDAGFTELIRPALYNSYHKIQNLSSNGTENIYDVVGPICESTDSFAKEISLPETKRGDLLAIRSAGAYGQVMSSTYNQRSLAKAYYLNDLL